MQFTQLTRHDTNDCTNTFMHMICLSNIFIGQKRVIHYYINLFFTNNSLTFKIVLYVTDFVTSYHNINSNDLFINRYHCPNTQRLLCVFCAQFFSMKCDCLLCSLQYKTNVYKISLKYSLMGFYNEDIIGIFTLFKLMMSQK
jgi:hypothetical protein